MRATIGICIGSLFLVGCAAPREDRASTTICVPIVEENSLPTVEVLIGGTTVRLAVDSGGACSQFPPAIGSELPMIREVESADANGVRRDQEVGPVILHFGPATIPDVIGQVPGPYMRRFHDGPDYKTSVPTIGLNVLARYRVTIDGPARQLRLASDAGPLVGEGWILFSGLPNQDPPSGHQVVSVRHGGSAAVPVYLDTGIDDSLANAAFSDHEFTVSESVFRIVTRPAPDGPVLTVGPASGEVGDRLECPVILGWSSLKHTILEISFRHHRLRITTPDGATIVAGNGSFVMP
jgi:hypothetical protein